MIRPLPELLSRPAPAVPPRPDYIPGLLVVRVKEDVVVGMPDVRGTTPAGRRSLKLPARVQEPFVALRRRMRIKEVVPVFARSTRGRPLAHARASVAAAVATSVQDSENDDLRGINVVRVSSDADLERAEKELNRSDGIEYAHRVPARWPAGTVKASANDPHVNRQWSLRAVRWFGVEPLPDARAVRVGVLDTGIDTHHPDLRFRSYAHDPESVEDIVGHGSHVAGIIAARSNNRVGITGICRCELHVFKIFGDKPASDGEYYVDEVMYQRALNMARNEGIRVVNLSIGGTRFNQTEALLIRRLIESGCVVVAAMGNEYTRGNPTEYPAAYDDVIAVGAANEADRRAPFSNTGRHIHIVAPGTNILSTLPIKPSAYRTEEDTEYNAWSGTSMATPHITAAVALMLAQNAKLTRAEIADRLAQSARKVPRMRTATKSKAYGYGLLDLPAALA